MYLLHLTTTKRYKDNSVNLVKSYFTQKILILEIFLPKDVLQDVDIQSARRNLRMDIEQNNTNYYRWIEAAMMIG